MRGNIMKNYIKDFSAVLLLVSILAVPFGAWVTHVIRCIHTEEWVFLIAGAIAAPVGVVHGIGIWFGAW